MHRRTALITAGAVAATVLAGATAVGANIGILSSADNSPLGELSATAVTSSTSSTVPSAVDLTAETVVPSAADVGSRRFAVADAGTVEVEAGPDGIRARDVVAAPGWVWSQRQVSDTALTVSFRSADSELVFVATLTPDGAIDAGVERPSISSTDGSIAPGSPVPATVGDDHDGDRGDDDVGDDSGGHRDDGDESSGPGSGDDGGGHHDGLDDDD